MRRWIAGLALLFAGVAASSAYAILPGTYRCRQYNVSGGGGSCRLASPIVLKADGTYQESTTAGTYEVRGDRIVFSASTIRGPGLVVGENMIRFEYDYKGFHHDVTYLCQDCAPGIPGKEPGASSDVQPAPPPSIGVWITDVTPEIASALGSSALKGAGVTKVTPGGPACRGGVLEGDVIVSVNDIEVDTATAAKLALQGRVRDFPVRLQVFRAGRIETLSLDK